MKKAIVIILMSIFLVNCSPQQSQDNMHMKASLQSTFDAFREQYHIPGAVLLVKTPDFEDVLTTGMTALDGGKPIEVDTLFGVGSITKTFISAMILKLEAEGKLSIHDQIGSYFPQYPRWKNITIDQLLNMTSGIPNYTNDQEFKNDLNANFKKTWSDDQLINIAYGRSDDFKPGTDWSYTNTGYLLLGKMIEQVTDQSVSQALSQTFFKPLKMHNTYYEKDAYPPEVFDRMARGYYNGGIVKSSDLTNIGAASGGMVMNAEDLANFLNHLFIEKDLLPKKQMNEMLTVSQLSSGKSGLANAKFASGLGVLQDPSLGQIFTFTGTLPTHTATYLIIPEKGIIIVALVAFDRHGDKDTDILFFGRPFFKNVLMNLHIKGLE